jgi:hypothetical protein
MMDPIGSAIHCRIFTFSINSRHVASDSVEAAVLSPAVHEQFLVDNCARMSVVRNEEANSVDFSSLQKYVSGSEIIVRQSSQK